MAAAAAVAVLVAAWAAVGLLRADERPETAGVTALPAIVAQGDGRPATETEIGRASDLVIGPDGLVHLALPEEDRVRRIGPDGVVMTVAAPAGTVCGTPDGGGSEGVSAATDLPGADARPAIPCGPVLLEVVDAALLILDADRGGLRLLDGDGAVGDLGLLPAALEVMGLAVDGERALLSDAAGGSVLEVSLGRDGPAGGDVAISPRLLASDLEQPAGLAVDLDGTLHVADRSGRVIRLVGQQLETAVGTPGPGEIAAIDDPDDPIQQPTDLAVDADGTMWIADPGSASVRYVVTAGTLRTVPFGFERPIALDVAPDGSVYVLDAGSATAVYRIGADLDVTRVAGGR